MSLVRSFVRSLCDGAIVWVAELSYVCVWVFCFLSEHKQHCEHNEGFIFVRYIFFILLSVSVSFATMVSQRGTTGECRAAFSICFSSRRHLLFSRTTTQANDEDDWRSLWIIIIIMRKMCMHVLSTTKHYMDDCALFACMHACLIFCTI